jgi:transposase
MFIIMKVLKEELKNLYLNKKMSCSDISKKLNINSSYVYYLLKKYNINIRTKKESAFVNHKNIENLLLINKENLIYLYSNNIYSIIDIAKMYNVSTGYIYSKLKEFNIEIKGSSKINKDKYIKIHNKSHEINKDLLQELYLNKLYSLDDIAKIYNVDKKWLSRRCKEFNIKVRTKKEAFSTSLYRNKKAEILKEKLKNYNFDSKNKNFFIPMYNPKSISIIEEFGKNNNFNFKHAENGGEVFLSDIFCWVDAYDSEKNVVLEYYETQHKYSIEHDINRIEKIKKHLNCQIIIIHENKDIEYF